MEKIKTNIHDHPAYSEFTGLNEQFLSELTGTIRDIISDLNTRNSITDEIFNKLTETIEVSNAVFRSFSNHEGLELVLRLKSISELYKRNLSDNSNLVKIADHLLKKLEKFSTGFYHEASSDEIIYPEFPPETKPDDLILKKDFLFKWTTFERNGSLFITKFNQLETFNYDAPSNNTSGTFEHNDKLYTLIDLMKTPDSDFNPPAKVLIINYGKFCYAADHTGREIHGTYDMLSPLIEPLEVTSRLFAGRVRIFGRKYLVLRYD